MGVGVGDVEKGGLLTSGQAGASPSSPPAIPSPSCLAAQESAPPPPLPTCSSRPRPFPPAPWQPPSISVASSTAPFPPAPSTLQSLPLQGKKTPLTPHTHLRPCHVPASHLQASKTGPALATPLFPLRKLPKRTSAGCCHHPLLKWLLSGSRMSSTLPKPRPLLTPSWHVMGPHISFWKLLVLGPTCPLTSLASPSLGWGWPASQGTVPTPRPQRPKHTEVSHAHIFSPVPAQTPSPPQRFCNVSCRERRRGLRAYGEGQGRMSCSEAGSTSFPMP